MSEDSPFINPFFGDGNQSVARNDGAVFNALVGIGENNIKDKLAQTGIGIAARLSVAQKEELFSTNPFCRSVCEVIPQKAIKKGWELTLPKDGDAEITTRFNDYEKRIAGLESDTEGDQLVSLADCFKHAQVLANVMDGAVIIINADDGLPPEEPLDRDKIKTIKSLDILDRTLVYPALEYNWDPLRPKYYNVVVGGNLISPDRMKEIFANAPGGTGQVYKIHRSRVIRFDGIQTTPNKMRRNHGWGGSPLDLLWESFKRWDVSQQAIANTLMDYSLFVYQLKGLANLVRDNQQQNLQDRFQTLRLMASILGGVAIDSEGEKLEFVNRQFTGIPDLLDRLRDSVIGASNLPHTLLFGESPSGLGATGESEEKTIADIVEEFQSTIWLPKLQRIYKLIFLAKDGPTKGKEPKGWGIKFHPILQESETEKATGRSTQAQTDNTYVSAGILLKEEVRDSRFGSGEYSYETKLDDEKWNEEQEKLKQQEEQMNAGGFGDFGDFGGFGDEVAAEQGDVEEEADKSPSVNQDSLSNGSDLWQQAIGKTSQTYRFSNSRYARAFQQECYKNLCKSKR